MAFPKPTPEDIDKRFDFSKPDEARGLLHQTVNNKTKALAKELVEMLPNGRNLSIVLTLLEDVRMRANCALATGQ